MTTTARDPAVPHIFLSRVAADAAVLLFLLVGALVLRLAFAPGLSGSDDTNYALRALEIVRGLWVPSNYVGDLRYGVNLPIAFFAAAFGASEFSLGLWSLLCSLGEIAVIYCVARVVWDRPAAALAGAVAALCPLHILLGSMALADAPVAFFITLAFAAFYFAERSGSPLLYALSGAALGFAWWVKPPAILVTAVFLAYALVMRRLRKEWLLVAVATAGVILAEWAMFWVKFGDPFYALKAINTGLDRDFVQHDAPWGSHAPFYYFRQMFLDGRDMTLAPVFALIGIAYLLRRSEWKNPRRGGYVLLWAVGLVLMLSFTPYSFSPLKLIPKQDNYALMFMAPMLMLAGYGLSRLPPVVRWPAFGLYAVSALALVSLQQYSVQINSSAIRMAMRMAENNSRAIFYSSVQVQKSLRLDALMNEAPEPELRPMAKLADTGFAPPAAAADRRIFAVVLPRSPEATKDPAWLLLEKRHPCWMPVFSVVPEGGAPGSFVLARMAELQWRLPYFVNKHLSFAYRLANREPVRVLEWNRACPGSVVR